MKKFVTVLACVVYVVSPIDLVPELFLGPFGLIDDAVVVLVGLRSLVKG